MASYSYATLPSDGSSIRLLRLLPSRDGETKVECDIFHASIVEAERVPYDALSYTWGDDSSKVKIWLNGDVFLATINLGAALRALRKTDETRTLWVDAVCINQEDPHERAEQVQMMWDIYNAAECVVVWLGPEEGESATAMTDFARRETQTRLAARLHPMARSAGCFDGDFCGCHAGDFDTHPPRDGVQNLLGRRWFTRVWVLQEVAAAKRVIIACGNQVVSGEDFFLEIRGVASFYMSFQKMIRKVRPAIELMHKSMGGLERQSRPLVELIETFRSWDATKDVDKVYSLLAFSSDAFNEPTLRPDYEISPAVLARKVVQFAFPGSRIDEQASAQSTTITFETQGFILGKITNKWSGKNNMRSWAFDAKSLTGGSNPLATKLNYQVAKLFKKSWQINILNGSNPLATKLNHQVAKLFKKSWQINILNERRLNFDNIVCLLHGASRPTVLGLDKGSFSVVMMAAPEPVSFIPEEEGSLSACPANSWADILSVLSTETEGSTKFRLTWDPFRQPAPAEVSRFLPTPNNWHTQWEARTESFKDTERQAREKGLQPPSHNCRTMAMLHMEYEYASDEIKDGTSEFTITLHEAAYKGWLGTARVLLDANVGVDGRDNTDATALHYAAQQGHAKVAKALLRAGSSVDALRGETTPLMLALTQGHTDICRLLLDAGASPDAPSSGASAPLLIPVVAGRVDAVQVLLKAGANPNAASRAGPIADVTALHLAAELGHTSIVKALIDAGAAVDACTTDGLMPLHQAAMNGHTEVVGQLLAAGAQVNAQDGNGVTPLDFAVYRKNLETARKIQDAGGVQVKTLKITEEMG